LIWYLYTICYQNLLKINILGERGPIGHSGLQGVKGEPGVAGPDGPTVSL